MYDVCSKTSRTMQQTSLKTNGRVMTGYGLGDWILLV